MFVLAGCVGDLGPPEAPPTGRLQVSHFEPTLAIDTGEHQLTTQSSGRDALLYVPGSYDPSVPVPLLVMLHGGAGDADGTRPLFEIADSLGMAVLSPDSRDYTWDMVAWGEFGEDVEFIEEALEYVFERVAIDPDRLALGGFSDGASYTLSLGLTNGDLFTHLLVFSPGLMRPSTLVGRPPVYLSHGTDDASLAVEFSRDQVVPILRHEGYEVTYVEFDGGHVVPKWVAEESMGWLADGG